MGALSKLMSSKGLIGMALTYDPSSAIGRDICNITIQCNYKIYMEHDGMLVSIL